MGRPEEDLKKEVRSPLCPQKRGANVSVWGLSHDRGSQVNTRMDKQERSVRERQGPSPPLGHAAPLSQEPALQSSVCRLL